jgi:hypothetical protein
MPGLIKPIHANSWSLIRLVLIFCLCIHWISCFWFRASVAQSDGEDEIESWVESQRQYKNGPYLDEVGPWIQYTSAVYVGILLMVGENIEPQTNGEKYTALFLLIFGSLFTAVIFGIQRSLEVPKSRCLLF